MLGWFGPMWGPFGYAVHNRMIVGAMIDLGAKILIAPSMYPEPPLSPEEERLLPFCGGFAQLPNDIITVHCIPANPLPRGDGYVIAYTTVESISAHPNVVARLMIYDEVWVPSAFARRSLIYGGLTSKDITVVPEGVDPDFWRPTGARPNLPRGAPLVLAYHGDWSTRKGVHELVFVTSRLATAAEPIRLVFWVNKGRDRSEKTRDEIMHDILAFVPNGEIPSALQIELDVREKTVREIRGLYNNCHYYVHLGKGEAWNLTLCDAAAVGAPCIALAAGGEKEFMVPRYFTRVKTDGHMMLSEMGRVGVGHHRDVPFSRINLLHLKKVMSAARGGYEQACKKAPKQSEYIREHVTWRIGAAHAISRLEKVSRSLHLPGPRDPAKFVDHKRTLLKTPASPAGDNGNQRRKQT